MKFFKKWSLLGFLMIAGIIFAACQPTAPSSQSPAIQDEQQPTEVQLLDKAFSQEKLGDCYNAYNPVEEGKIWKYTSTSGTETSIIEMSYKNVTQSTFTSVQKFTDLSTEAQWTCSADGLISDQLINVNISQIPGVSIETTEVKGIVFPKENLWQAGYSWDTEYVIAVKFTNGGTVLEGTGNLMLTNTITGKESVTVPANVYDDALHVDVTGTMKVGILGVENTIPITFTNWFVKDTGLIKSASTDAALPFSMELTSIE